MSKRDAGIAVAFLAVIGVVVVSQLLTGDIRLIALALCAGLLIAGSWFATSGH